jgi:hypothetical protein
LRRRLNGAGFLWGLLAFGGLWCLIHGSEIIVTQKLLDNF